MAEYHLTWPVSTTDIQKLRVKDILYDTGSLYIHEWQGVGSKTTVIPLEMAKAACELVQTCQGLLAFIEAHNMGGDWCQDNYP